MHFPPKILPGIRSLIRKRLIARIDVKNEYAIKGIQLEGLRKVGDPKAMAKKYYDAGADEILFMDAVAAYYDRNSLSELIAFATDNVFIPITVGGGIRTIEDIQTALNSGADKVSINTQAIKNLDFIREASRIYGSQCIVASVDAKRIEDDWYAYYDNGRESSGLNVKQWCQSLQDAGAGELLLTSVDRDGTKEGFDEELIDSLGNSIDIPMILSGGAGSVEHINTVIEHKYVDAVAVASVLHYKIHSMSELKSSPYLSSSESRV